MSATLPFERGTALPPPPRFLIIDEVDRAFRTRRERAEIAKSE